VEQWPGGLSRSYATRVSVQIMCMASGAFTFSLKRQSPTSREVGGDAGSADPASGPRAYPDLQIGVGRGGGAG
jgi:hypothetical protein